MDAITRKKPVLKLVHPGGLAERHKKPITAAEVMKKNPRHFVTRPDVFKFPWIVVRPESVLQPGDVFYIVPFHTVRGLLRRKAFLYQLLNQQQSPDSCRSEDKESERTSELFQIGSCPYDSSSGRTKIVKRRSPNACQKTERCRLGECYAGNLTSSKKHCLDQLGEILQQQQQGRDSPSIKRNKARSRHRPCEQFLEELCTFDSSNEVTHTQRQIMRSHNRRSVHLVGRHQSLLLCPTKQHLALFVEKNSPNGTSFHTRVSSENKLSPAKLSRPKYTGGDYYPVKKRQSSDAFWTMKCPKLGEHDWQESSPEEGGFRWLEKLQPPDSCQDARSPCYGDQIMGNEPFFDIFIDGKVSIGCGDCQKMRGHYGGAKIKNLTWAGRAQDDPHRPSDDKGNRIFQRDDPEMKLDQAPDDVFKLKSCLKKNKNKLSGRRVRFTLPGEDDDNSSVEVFDFRDKETP
ncbi:hypothetical protein BT93_H1075 [Corymbia citriodora subsp. variegata]|nr:hypothetical protein BT93_H1075 [Corymbia citriodora subsp. variegata]